MTYLPTHDPRVTATVDLLVDALLAASHEGRITERYCQNGNATREQVDEAFAKARDLHSAAQTAIYNLARDLAAEHGAVAS